MAAKRVALVVRVSTDRQAGNPEGSLKNQLQRLRQHIAYKRDGLGEDWQEVALFELKGISGKSSLRRSELQPLLAGIRANQINVIACTALDRLCRNVRDFLELLELLNEHGVEFVCLKQNYDTTTPQGKLFITIMMALAEFEREQTSERTKDAVRARAERGLWNGGRVLGYDPDPTNKSSLVINQEEAAVVNAAFQLYLQTGSLKDTASALNERGHRTKSYTSRRGLVHPGKPFSLTAVQGLLKNRAFIAMKEIGKRNKRGVEVVPAVWPPIVPLETFDEVQQLMAANGQRRHNSAEGIKHVHVLVGLLHCGLCGTALQGRSGTGRLARRYYYYTCPSQGCGLRVVADEIEGAVLDHIGELAQTEGLLERLVEETNTRLLKQKPALLRQQKALWRNLAEVNARAGSLLTEWSTVTADHGKRFVTEKLTELAERRAALERGVAELEQQLAKVQDKAVTAEVVRAALSQVQQVYACLKPYEQRGAGAFSITPSGGTCERTGFGDQQRRRAGNHARDGQQRGCGSPDTGLAPRHGVPERVQTSLPHPLTQPGCLVSPPRQQPRGSGGTMAAAARPRLCANSRYACSHAGRLTSKGHPGPGSCGTVR